MLENREVDRGLRIGFPCCSKEIFQKPLDALGFPELQPTDFTLGCLSCKGISFPLDAKRMQISENV